MLHLTAMTSTKYGGLEKYLVELARRCHIRGYSSVLQYNGMPESSLYLSDLEAAGGQVVVAPPNEGWISATARAMRLIVRLRPEVVHIHFPLSPTVLVVGVLARRLGVRRVVATMHLIPVFDSRALARVAYSRMDRVLCVSHAVEATMKSVGVPQELLCTHYLGVPASPTPPIAIRQGIREQLSIPQEASVILTVGWVERVKGIDVVLDAFVDHLADRFPDLHLVVVGISPLERTLVSPRADCLPERVHWAGITNDIGAYMAAADVYIQASRSEGLGLAVLEAMVHGLPVVATSVGGIPEVVVDGENGLLVPSESPGKLANAVSRLLADDALRARLARAGCETCKRRFDLAQSVESLISQHYQFS